MRPSADSHCVMPEKPSRFGSSMSTAYHSLLVFVHNPLPIEDELKIRHHEIDMLCTYFMFSFPTANVVAELHYCWVLAGRMLHPSGFGLKLRLGQTSLVKVVPPKPLDL